MVVYAILAREVTVVGRSRDDDPVVWQRLGRGLSLIGLVWVVDLGAGGVLPCTRLKSCRKAAYLLQNLFDGV